MGCISSIVMMLKEPDLFAAPLLVAGKWNPSLMGPLDKQNIRTKVASRLFKAG